MSKDLFFSRSENIIAGAKKRRQENGALLLYDSVFILLRTEQDGNQR